MRKYNSKFIIFSLMILLQSFASCSSLKTQYPIKADSSPAGKIDFDSVMDEQILELSEAEKESLNKNHVIIRGDLIFVGTHAVNGTELSELIISPSLIEDAENRFLISHFLRNVLISDAAIKNFDESGNDFSMQPVVDVNEDFVLKHGEKICDVLYFLLGRSHFNLYEKTHGSAEKIFESEMLSALKNQLQDLKEKMIRDGELVLVWDLASNQDGKKSGVGEDIFHYAYDGVRKSYKDYYKMQPDYFVNGPFPTSGLDAKMGWEKYYSVGPDGDDYIYIIKYLEKGKSLLIQNISIYEPTEDLFLGKYMGKNKEVILSDFPLESYGRDKGFVIFYEGKDVLISVSLKEDIITHIDIRTNQDEELQKKYLKELYGE